MKIGVLMKRPTHLLVTLFVLAAHGMAADESTVVAEENVTLNEEVASLQRRNRSDLVPGHKDRLTMLEEQMNEVYTDTVRDTFGAKAASARPQIDSYGLYVGGDLLYWKAFEGGLDYVVDTNTTTSPFTGTSTTQRMDFNWRFGFKAELGYRTPHDGWDLMAHYTWFFDKAHDTSQAPAGGGETPLLPNFYTSAGVRSRADWRFHFHDGDLALQKSYFLSHAFSLTPIAALRTTWIDQKMEAFYFTPSAAQVNVTQQGKNEFWGIGPKMGVSSRWYVNGNWHFFGGCSGSLLYGEFDVSERTIVNGLPTINVVADLHRIVPTVQGFLGFGWEWSFCSKAYHIAADVSYEAQYWWRQNQQFSFSNTATPLMKRIAGDFGLHGLTFNASFDF
ncbi:MAG: hypothetical protein JSS32_08060 [Verrucomicrobia bacterium]|nr:hypothetical protein [Verrucomicrobiota bacterium]